jgi:hypothetical protein
MKMNTFNAVVLMVNGAHGVYVPETFATMIDPSQWSGISDEDLLALQLREFGEDGAYWETWDTVLNNATYTDKDGNVFRLHQDGDLWAYCIERMSLEEQQNMFQCSDFYIPDGFTLFEIGEHFVTCLYYGDRDHLSDDEESTLDAFIEQYGDDVRDSCGAGEFGECEITGLRGKTAYVLLKDK